MLENKKSVEVCFSNALYPDFHKDEAIVVVTDVLRATSAICTAFMNGVERIIPVATIEEAKSFKERGFMVAAERDGLVKDFADFGNSPFNFSADRVMGKTIVYSTTNGTQAVQLAGNSHKIVIGSFLNNKAICDWLVSQKRDVVILCAGWKNKFNLEDTIHAGSMVEQLLNSGCFATICDSAIASLDLWGIAKNNLVKYIDKAAQKTRLKKNNLDDVIEYCLTPDITAIIPIFVKGSIVKLDE